MHIVPAFLMFGLIVPSTCCVADESTAADRPNFVVIFCDDLGYGDLGCFGSESIATPHLDRLADQGMRLTSFYVPVPLCTPSRAALLTGCYPVRVGLGRGVLRPDARRGLNPDEITLAEVLNPQGYATACIGKWHLGFRPPFRPNRQGFDHYYGIYHNLDEYEAPFFDEVGGMPILRNEEVAERPATPEILTERYTAEAVRFIKDHANEPFFLYLAHTMPHVPLGATARFRDRSRGGLYGDVVECLDWSTGQIIEALDRLELADRTLVLFTSDNGPSPRATGSAGPLRGRKHQTYEGGVRVPTIARWPGRIPAGSTQDAIVTTMDLLPTFARLAGAKIPDDRPIDGLDVSDAFLQIDADPRDRFFYYDGRGRVRGVRHGDWKLLRLGQGPELYDLSSDLGETRNRALDHPEIVEQLDHLIADHTREIQANLRPVGSVDSDSSK